MKFYLQRESSRLLDRFAKGFPIIGITGPRQSGKTTLARHHFADKPYVTLENPDHLHFAQEDPRGFLAHYPDGAIFDEIQRCPSLFSYIQGQVDGSGQMARYILTGSQQFGLRAGISQSLAGRIGLLQLLPFSLRELQNNKIAQEPLYTLIHKGFTHPSTIGH